MIMYLYINRLTNQSQIRITFSTDEMLDIGSYQRVISRASTSTYIYIDDKNKMQVFCKINLN